MRGLFQSPIFLSVIFSICLNACDQLPPVEQSPISSTNKDQLDTENKIHYEPKVDPQTDSPCRNVACSNPPNPFCDLSKDSSLLIRFTPEGTCSDGQCLYTSISQPCTYGCEKAKCLGNPCEGVNCNAPPQNYCNNLQSLAVYEIMGVCVLGKCKYKTREVTCDNGCSNGECKKDPCLGKSCTKPPANYCEADSTLIANDPAGVCEDGECKYTVSQIECADGCYSGECNEDPCLGKRCLIPPANHCSPLSNSVTNYAPEGRCVDGICVYEQTQAPCGPGDTCVDAQCMDQCEAVQCNTGQECDGSFLRIFDGTCTNGNCGFSQTECPYGCSFGKCNEDPCETVVCSADPVCDGNIAVRHLGQCINGLCEYEEDPQLCKVYMECDGGRLKTYDGSCLSGQCTSVSEKAPICQCQGGFCHAINGNTSTCSNRIGMGGILFVDSDSCTEKTDFTTAAVDLCAENGMYLSNFGVLENKDFPKPPCFAKNQYHAGTFTCCATE